MKKLIFIILAFFAVFTIIGTFVEAGTAEENLAAGLEASISIEKPVEIVQ